MHLNLSKIKRDDNSYFQLKVPIIVPVITIKVGKLSKFRAGFDELSIWELEATLEALEESFCRAFSNKWEVIGKKSDLQLSARQVEIKKAMEMMIASVEEY